MPHQPAQRQDASAGALEQAMYQDWLSSEATTEGLVNKVRGNPDYVKFLLIEYPRIRSALDVQALTLDEEEKINRMPSSIGNALHLDLIILDEWWAQMSPQDQRHLRSWAMRQERAPAVGHRHISSYRDFSKPNQARRVGPLISQLQERLDIRPEEVPI